MLATFVYPNHIVCLCMGIMRAILGSHQRLAFGCANLFPTNLSLTCRLPATSSRLGIGRMLLLLICKNECKTSSFG
ncbi:hypothetical protein B8T99_12220 [Vibrio cholerae]|uniref:Uncharacterized protein n=1 Tax=Vibrio cholerae TaxID=666 RepID=A0A2V4NI53_VIBCL|nr:hypothetical protein A6J62_08885 [Vibrio cholerae]AVH51846.1 hypothetical protein C4E16_05640 [Vibrio cholerae O1 biovar El Tor]OWH60474.1 hypothetical protein CBG28_13360 [Vibrio cholerae O139]ATQ46709.1 hypothetical protein CSW01_08390 [Vibrio cholerae]AUR69911.1 hypothetical protein C1H56_07380 [Vibrio cholerae]